jgi:quercetin dioxygenase-like cupin family protein
MGFPIYDYRTDVRNVLVTPQIRARFLRMEPGQVAALHSHDLGHEVFLILEGRAVFEIDGETQELGPGQMCVALADQVHTVRAAGEEPMTMYLSVTPHIQPSHTMRTPEGERLPLRFMPASAYDEEAGYPPERSEGRVLAVGMEALLDRQVAAAQAVAEAAEASASVQREMAGQLARALAEGDDRAAAEARRAMWEALYATYRTVYDLGAAWNALAAWTAKVP